MLTQIFHPTVFVGVDLLPLKSFHEALTFGVVPRICKAAHACDDLMLVQEFAVVARGILNAAVRVMHKPRTGCSTCDRILQSCDRQLRGQGSIKCPADYLT